MSKLKYLLYKDLLLLVRDIAGMLLMFLMPVVLVILMSLLQDSTLNSVRDAKVPILLVNKDTGELGKAVESEIYRTGIFDVSQDVDGVIPSIDQLEKAIASSRFVLGIYIPENTTDDIRLNVAKYVSAAFNGVETSTEHIPVDFTVYIDPTTKSSFNSTVMSTLKEKAQKIQFEYIMKEITKQVNLLSPVPISSNSFSGDQVRIEVKSAHLEGNDIVPNSVQHNVPAWSLFAIFFIVISLSGSIIKEREEGSFSRLLTMPCSYTEYLISKAIIYTVVAILQFAIMLLIGVYLLPYFGLESLNLGSSFMALGLLALSSAFAAIGYGIAIGNIARTYQQSSVFGAMSVVIMAAIGGVWIPLFLMSETMRTISLLSPMHWGISGFYDIFLKDAGVMAILPESAALLMFGALCFIIAVTYNHKYRMDI
jgi:ABC-2 type transport system permease protein